MRTVLRFTAAAGILFSLAGCSNGISTKESPTASPTHSSTVAPAISSCLTSQLSWDPGVGGIAMGHVGFTGAGFKNISATTCTLQGYPDLQMLDATGHPIPTHVIHGNSYNVTSSPDEVVTLAPGAEALFDLGFDSSTGYATEVCPTSAQVKITPPNTTEPLTVSWQIQPYGGGSIPKLRCGEITVSPVYPR